CTTARAHCSDSGCCSRNYYGLDSW
nr:immunoglobulin heavy chain junction region [Macaca mulatta]